jgi:hypothetical protein
MEEDATRQPAARRTPGMPDVIACNWMGKGLHVRRTDRHSRRRLAAECRWPDGRSMPIAFTPNRESAVHAQALHA